VALDTWHALIASGAAVGVAVVLTRQALRGWSLRRLERLADELTALERWWRIIERLPAELQTQSLRVTIGRILYQRVQRARRIHPDHPTLREAALRVARFIGRTPRNAGRPVTGAARADAMATLADLKQLLVESARDRLISARQIDRCAHEVAASLAALEFQHYRQAALQAEYLQRIPQAVECLRAALGCAAHLTPGAPERRDVEARLALLEARLATPGHGQPDRLPPVVG
jgi:hypothetical protein